MTVLDVGCGDGLIALGALERVGSTGRVIFADVSPELLERAKRSVHDRGLASRARFVQVRAENLAAVPDESVDVVTTRSVLIYVADKSAAFAAIHRVLRPGGRVSLFEPINKLMYPEPDDRLWGYDISPVIELANRVKREFRRLSDPATGSMHDFDDRDLFRYAIDAGFPEVHLTLQLGIAPSLPSSDPGLHGSARGTLAVCLLMALSGRDLLLPLTGHLDGTSGRRWSKSGPLHVISVLEDRCAKVRLFVGEGGGGAARRRLELGTFSLSPIRAERTEHGGQPSEVGDSRYGWDREHVRDRLAAERFRRCDRGGVAKSGIR